MKKYLFYILLVIFILLFLINILVISNIKANKKQTLIYYRDYSVAVVHNDYEDYDIKSGYIVTLLKIPLSEIQVDDVIIYKHVEFNKIYIGKVVSVSSDVVQIVRVYEEHDYYDNVTEDLYFGIMLSSNKMLNIGGFLLKDRNINFVYIVQLFYLIAIVELFRFRYPHIFKKLNHF